MNISYPKTIVLLVLLFSFLPMNPSLLEADSSTDILPLGPSKYKFLLQQVEQDQIINSATTKAISLEQLIDETVKTNVYIIGEAHDNYECHTFQRDFIKALYKKHPKIIVGFEFFWHQDDEALEKWRTGQISKDELLKSVGWYDRGGMNYGYTGLIMDVIKENKIKTIGLNVNRDVVRQVSRKGFNTLSPEKKALFPTISIPNIEHKYFIKSIFGLMALQMPTWFTNIYDAQKCWDVVMAETMRKMLAKKEYKGYKGIIIAGNNHVAYKLGIPFRYKKAAKRARLTTISPVLLPKPKESKGDQVGHPMMGMSKSSKPSVMFSRGIADYVFAAKQPKYHHYPVIGFSLKLKEEKLMVTRVSKKSIAAKHGLSKGDQIISFDGVDIKTLGQFRIMLAQKNWNDSFRIGVIKKIEIKKDGIKKLDKKKKAMKGMKGTEKPKDKKPGKHPMAPKKKKEHK